MRLKYGSPVLKSFCKRSSTVRGSAWRSRSYIWIPSARSLICISVELRLPGPLEHQKGPRRPSAIAATATNAATHAATLMEIGADVHFPVPSPPVSVVAMLGIIPGDDRISAPRPVHHGGPGRTTRNPWRATRGAMESGHGGHGRAPADEPRGRDRKS